MPSTSLASIGRKDVARPLAVLAPLIKQDIAEGNDAGDLHYRNAGEKLLEAVEQFGGRTPAFWEWVRRNFKDSNGKPLSPGAAKRWMQFANVPDDPKKPFKSLDDFRRRHLHEDVLTGSKRNRKMFGPAKAVLREVDVEALRQSAQSAAKERDMERTLYLQMIDIGFKILAVKLHSDKGGKDEAMARLNRVRARAKSLA